MLLTTLVLHLLLGRYMVAAEVGARAATKGSMAEAGRDFLWISASALRIVRDRQRRAPLRGGGEDALHRQVGQKTRETVATQNRPRIPPVSVLAPPQRLWTLA